MIRGIEKSKTLGDDTKRDRAPTNALLDFAEAVGEQPRPKTSP